MIKINTDMHIHTMVSQHAYSTIAENVKFASEEGIEAIAITDHGPGTLDGGKPYHFSTMENFIPDYLYGVRVLKGIECSFVNPEGDLDVKGNSLFNKLDLVIASCHESVYYPKEKDEYTNLLMLAMDNPHIDILGHIDRPECEADYDLIAKTAKEKGKIIELNEASFIRPPFEENALRVEKVMTACKKHGTKICVNSDSHFFITIGKYEKSIELLTKIGFDEKNIVNRDFKTFEEFINKKSEI